MQKMNIILETTFSTVTPGDGTVAHKHVLHREANGCITYNRVQSDETGWETTCFHEDLEKGIKFFLKQVAADRKSFLGNKSMKIILPGIRFQTFLLAPFLTDEVSVCRTMLNMPVKSTTPVEPLKPLRLCQDPSDISRYLSDAYDDTIAVMSTSQRAIITLLQQGGSWAWRMYEAMPDVIDPLLKRIIQQES